LTRQIVRALLNWLVDEKPTDRELLVALMSALDEPETAASLSPSERAIQVARHHRLSPLLSALCGPWLPAGLAEPFRRDRILTAARNIMLAQATAECTRALGAAGVPTIVLKGLDYATRLYDAAGARPTSDVDLLIPDEHRRTAFATLDRLGFEPRAAAPGFDDADYHEVAWARGAVEVDLHMGLAPVARCPIDYRAVWSAAIPRRVADADTLALSDEHAVLFHALHMAIDHFDVPAIYLLDLSRLASRADEEAMVRTATAWRCRRPLATALVLAGAFLPRWRATQKTSVVGRVEARVIAQYGSVSRLPRAEQLFRKVMHFDTVRDATRYLAVQAQRNARERLERWRGRSARERLNLGR
jgi:hypothetical protein